MDFTLLFSSERIKHMGETMGKKKDICSYTYEELAEEMKAAGEKAFRARQIYQWLHVKLADSFDEMTNLSRALREKLDKEYQIARVELVERQISKADPTEKFLFELEDGNMVESVLMKYDYGNSVCISSQAGCRMGCRFCASTIGGLKRNLKASEMLRQIYKIQKTTGERVSNIVVMGTGEPLDNYDNFVRFIRMISAPEGLNISQRNITASTCGIVPGILRLALVSVLSLGFLNLVHSTRAPRRRERASCLWPTDMSSQRCWRPAIHILRRPAEGSPLSTAW